MKEYILVVDWDTKEWVLLNVYNDNLLTGMGLECLEIYIPILCDKVYVWGGLTYLFLDKLIKEYGVPIVAINVRDRIPISIDSLYALILGNNNIENPNIEKTVKLIKIVVNIIQIYETS